jgi:hypothetical protein
MIAAYYNSTVPTSQDIINAADWLAINDIDGYKINNYDGTNLSAADLVTFAQRYFGFTDIQKTNSPDVNALFSEVTQNHPVIVGVLTNMGLRSDDTDHFMVLRGFQLAQPGVISDTDKVIVNDPGHDVSLGIAADYSGYTVAQFKAAWKTQSYAAVLIHANSPPQAPVWTQKLLTANPTGVGTMAYDPSRAQTVLFTVNDETWIWNGTDWSLSPATGPDFESGGQMVYDSVHQHLVLFVSSGSSASTWVWNGSGWIDESDAPVDAGYHFSLAFDAARGLVVEYGGLTPGLQFLDEPWLWDGSTWTQGPSNSSNSVYGAAMTYDPAQSNTVLFGGVQSTNTGFWLTQNNTWLWNGSSWLQSFPTTVPTPRQNASMVYDDALGEVVMFGGLANDDATPVADNTWLWNGSIWIQEPSASSPPASAFQAMAYDVARGQVVLFTNGQTWVWPHP